MKNTAQQALRRRRPPPIEWQPPVRLRTSASSERIKFRTRVQKSRAPCFCPSHPGILWASYVADLVLDEPLIDPGAVPASSWSCAPGNGGVVVRRAWHTNRRTHTVRPEIQPDDLEEDGDE